MTRTHKPLAKLASSLLLLCLSFAVQSADTIRLDNDSDRVTIQDTAKFLPGSGKMIFDDVLSRSKDEFLPLTSDSAPTSGEAFWWKTTLENRLSSPLSVVIFSGRRFIESLKVYSVGEDRTHLIFSSHADQPFTDRKVAHRLIQGHLVLLPNQRVELIVQQQVKDGLAPELFISSSSSYQRSDIRATSIDLLFSGLILALIAVNLFHYMATRVGAYAIYALQESSYLLYILTIESYTYMWLWPDSPRFNQEISGLLGLSTTLTSLLFLRAFLGTKQRSPRLHLCINMMIGFIFFYALVYGFSGSIVMKKYAFICAVAAALLCVTTAVWVYFGGYRGARFYLLAWITLGSCVLIYSLFGMGYIPITVEQMTIIKSGIALEGLLMSLALSDQVRQINQERKQLQVDLVSSLEQRTVEMEQLLALEQERSAAVQSARNKAAEIASASHDIRQPLAALRMGVHNMEAGELKGHTEKTLDYMESILGDLISDNREAVLESDSLALSSLFDELCFRYGERAVSNNVELRLVPSCCVVNVPEALITRVLENLLSNAIRYAPGGKVLLGVRRRKSGIDIQVLDTGEGLTEEEIQLVSQPFYRGIKEEGSHGEGLGLSIVHQLCQQAGLDFSITSTPGRGSCFSVSIPV